MENRIPENHRMLLDELIKKSNTLPWKKSNSKNEIMCKFDNHFIKIFKESNFNLVSRSLMHLDFWKKVPKQWVKTIQI